MQTNQVFNVDIDTMDGWMKTYEMILKTICLTTLNNTQNNYISTFLKSDTINCIDDQDTQRVPYNEEIADELVSK
jgi:hypothetical protein